MVVTGKVIRNATDTVYVQNDEKCSLIRVSSEDSLKFLPRFWFHP